MKYLLIFIIILLLPGCGETSYKMKKTRTDNRKIIPDQESWNSTIRFTDEGKLKAVVFADYLEKYDQKQLILLKKIKIDFYGKEGNLETTLTADEGKVDELSNNMFAIGNVVAVNDSGVVLKTTELNWRENDRKILTDKFVTITSKEENIQGYGFESDQSIRNYQVFRPVINSQLKENK